MNAAGESRGHERRGRGTIREGGASATELEKGNRERRGVGVNL